MDVSPPARPSVGRLKDARKSRITNGSALLPGVDGRSAWIRRCKDLIQIHEADLGGAENVSSAERSLVRRAAVLSVELESLEAQFSVAGQASAEQLDLYQRTASSLRRFLETIGIQRRPRDVTTPTVEQYISHIHGAAE